MIWVPTDDNGCRFGDHCPRRAIDFIKNKVINKKKINNFFNLCFTTIIKHPTPQPMPWMGRPRI